MRLVADIDYRLAKLYRVLDLDTNKYIPDCIAADDIVGWYTGICGPFNSDGTYNIYAKTGNILLVNTEWDDLELQIKIAKAKKEGNK